MPVLIVRAGRDNKALNQGIDRLTAQAVAGGAPWTLINAPGSHHAFDVLDETEESRRIVKATLQYFREFLEPPASPAAPPSLARRALAHWFAHEHAEAAAAYARLKEEFHLTQEDVARRVGKDRATVANSLRLLKLPGTVRDRIREGSLSAGHAKAIAALASPDDQEKLAEEIVRRALSVRQAEKRAASFGRLSVLYGCSDSINAWASAETRSIFPSGRLRPSTSPPFPMALDSNSFAVSQTGNPV